MAHCPATEGQRGFSLVELLVALGIFAVMAALAYGGATALLAGKETLTRRHEELAELQVGLHLLQRDLQQMVNHTLFLPDDRETAALIGRGDFMEFTQRGDIAQRVRYRFAGDSLLRSVTGVRDTASGEGVATLSGLNRLTFRFLAQSGQWQEQWGEQKQRTLLPVAVAITLEKEGWGNVYRLFRSGALTEQKAVPP